jgi:hypothetical protein
MSIQTVADGDSPSIARALTLLDRFDENHSIYPVRLRPHQPDPFSSGVTPSRRRFQSSEVESGPEARAVNLNFRVVKHAVLYLRSTILGGMSVKSPAMTVEFYSFE